MGRAAAQRTALQLERVFVFQMTGRNPEPVVHGVKRMSSIAAPHSSRVLVIDGNDLGMNKYSAMLLLGLFLSFWGVVVSPSW